MEKTVASLDEFDEAVHRLGDIFYRLVASEMGEKLWERAVLEVRFAGDGSYWDHKIRVTTANQSVVSVSGNDDLTYSLIRMNELRTVLGWYSLKLEVNKDRKVVIQYGYDPKAVEDPSFYDD